MANTDTNSYSSDFIEFCKSQLSPLVPIEFSDFLDTPDQLDIELGSVDEREDFEVMSFSSKPSVIRLNMENYFGIADKMVYFHPKKSFTKLKKDEKEKHDHEHEKSQTMIKRHQIMIEKDQSVEENKSVSAEGLESAKERKVITVVSKSGKKSACNCRKTHCLKLYCDCLAQGKFCGPDCFCVDCKNNPGHVEIQNIEYKEEMEEVDAKENDEGNMVKVKEASRSPVLKGEKGCNCKKSGCNKKYCECFAMGAQCGKECKCVDCRNNAHFVEGKKSSNANLVKKSAIRKMEKDKKMKKTKIQAIKDLKEKTLAIKEEDGKMDLLYLESPEVGK